MVRTLGTAWQRSAPLPLTKSSFSALFLFRRLRRLSAIHIYQLPTGAGLVCASVIPQLLCIITCKASHMWPFGARVEGSWRSGNWCMQAIEAEWKPYRRHFNLQKKFIPRHARTCLAPVWFKLYSVWVTVGDGVELHVGQHAGSPAGLHVSGLGLGTVQRLS
jgi:hypothetical protein